MSTIKPRVFNNAVFMPELFPAKLTIPASQNIKYDFTCENSTTVADFRQQVLDNTDSNVSSFELMKNVAPNSEATSVDSMTMGELKAEKFRMRVNNKIYDVYPDLISILKKTGVEVDSAKKSKKAPASNGEDEAKTDSMASSIPIGRAAILKEFYGVLLA